MNAPTLLITSTSNRTDNNMAEGGGLRAPSMARENPMKKALVLAVAMLAVAVFGVMVVFAGPQYVYRNDSITTNTANAFVNHMVDDISIASAMFSFDATGTYTCRIEVVEQGGFTNRVLNEVITSGQYGTWVPEGKVWVMKAANTGTVYVTCIGATSTSVAKVRIQFDK